MWRAACGVSLLFGLVLGLATDPASAQKPDPDKLVDPDKKPVAGKTADPDKKPVPGKLADPDKKPVPGKLADPDKKPLPGKLADPDKKPTPEKKPDPDRPVGRGKLEQRSQPAPKERLIRAELIGRVASVEGSQKYITLQIPQSAPVWSGYGIRWQTTYKNVELQASDDIKVRWLNPPQEYDEKGRPKRYTPKELKELKGPDPKLPGYAGEFEHLRADQIVRVSVVIKPPPPQRPAAKPMNRGKDVDRNRPEEAAPGMEERPQATMVVILAEPQR